MSKTHIIESEQVSIPWKQIHVPDDFNIRRDLPEIKKLAADILEKGQITPVVVRNGGPKDRPFTLVAGSRRMSAWEMNGWQDRPIMAVVRKYKAGDALSRIADNWVENNERESVSPFDQAEMLNRLVEGTYPVDEGETPVKQNRDEICAKFNISKAQLQKMLKMFHSIDADVARVARKAQVPLRLLFLISTIEGKGKDADAVAEDKAAKQLEKLETYLKQQAQLAAEGRQRSVRSDRGQKKKGDGKDSAQVGVVKPSKRVEHAAYTDEKERGYPVADYLTVLLAKHEELASKNTIEARQEASKLEGIAIGIRFMTGELKRLPGLNAGDFREVLAPVEVEEEGE